MELVHPEALPVRFQSLLRRHHYLGGIKPVGERLYYVAALARAVARLAGLLRGSQTFALIWEKWIGWTEAQRRKRLGLVTK